MTSLGDILELAYGKALKADDRCEGNIPVYGSNGQVGWHDERLVAGPGNRSGSKGQSGNHDLGFGGFLSNRHHVLRNTEAGRPKLGVPISCSSNTRSCFARRRFGSAWAESQPRIHEPASCRLWPSLLSLMASRARSQFSRIRLTNKVIC